MIELLIVCAVLTALATMSWPAMRGLLSKGRLRQAADELESTLHKTRTRAIQSGTSLILRYAPDGRTYRVESWETMRRDEINEEVDTERTPGGTMLAGATPRILPIAKELPEGVTFANSHPQMNERLQALPLPEDAFKVATTVVSTERPSSDLKWAEPIVFHANGRSENASIRLVNERRFFIDVTLRGLTGRVTTTAPARLPQDDPLTAAADSPAVSSDDEGAMR